jgi:hypothetical protein
MTLSIYFVSQIRADDLRSQHNPFKSGSPSGVLHIVAAILLKKGYKTWR